MGTMKKVRRTGGKCRVEWDGGPAVRFAVGEVKDVPVALASVLADRKGFELVADAPPKRELKTKPAEKE
jgi:hypothetical protein